MTDHDPIPGLDRLATEIAPGRDLFADIERRVQSPLAALTRALRVRVGLSLATAAAALGLFLWMPQPPPAPPTVAHADPAALADPALAEALATYRQAGAALQKALEARREDIPDPVWRDVAQSLRDIDAQLEQIEAALAQDPADPRLLSFAFAAHQQRVAVLGRLVQTFSRS